MQDVAEKERAWFAREKDANDQALRRMRALCPVGVTSFTVPQLEQRVIEAGSLYPRQLSMRLKVDRGIVRFQLCIDRLMDLWGLYGKGGGISLNDRFAGGMVDLLFFS